MSAKLGAMMARKPYWSIAQGACSRDEPQPKFSRASSTLAPCEARLVEHEVRVQRLAASVVLTRLADLSR
jgi:hypothetical protein